MSASENREIPQPIPTLKELISTSVFSPTVSIPDGIKKIDLGTIGQEADGLLDRSLKDSNGLERSKTILVSQNGEVKISSYDDVGVITEEGQSTYPRPIVVKTFPNSQYHKRYDYYCGGLVHSHGYHDVPMSPQDFSNLFGNTDTPLGILPMIMVITPELKQIAFRSKNTPQWKDEFVQQKVLQWNNLLTANIQNKIKPNMSLQEFEGINAVVIHKYIRSMKEKYDLKLYSCPVDKNIVVEESA